MNIIHITSLILGIAASLVPNFLFRQVFFQHATSSPEHIVRRFYWAAVIKFVGFILLFILILRWPVLQAKYFFGAFVFTQLARSLLFWFSLPRIITR